MGDIFVELLVNSVGDFLCLIHVFCVVRIHVNI